MITVGKKQTLLVDSEDSSGFYLLCTDSQEVFLPGTLAPKGLKPGEKVEVFVYVNSEGDEIATGTMPKAEVGDFVCLEVKAVTPHGAYLDMGLPKDLLVPKSVQKYEMKVGQTHLVRVMLEDDTNRMFGTEKVGEFIETASVPLLPKQTITLVPFHKTQLGYKVLIEDSYLGIVYHNEIFEEVEIGKLYEGTVKSVREDGHVDALMRKYGKDANLNNSDRILEALKSSGGKINLSDKSSPDDIREAFSISKKAFKAAIGALYRQRLIKIENDSIELILVS